MREYIEKCRARALMKSYRSSLSATEHEKLCRSIFDNLINSGIISCQTQYILSFASYGSEPDTNLIDAGIRKRFKRIKIAYPKVLNDRENMEFYIVDSYEAMEPGYMKIPEPGDNYPKLSPDEQDMSVIIVPGLAFDMEGARAGYGGGFYDRYLCRYRHIIKAAICFDEQVITDKYIIKDKHDIRMDYIITDKKVIRIKEGI